MTKLSEYSLVFIGGALGTLCRYALDSEEHTYAFFFLYNLLGCFLMGFLCHYLKAHSNFPAPLKSLIQTGFLGSFTSYSAILLLLFVELGTNLQILWHLSLNIGLSIVVFIVGALLAHLFNSLGR